MRFLRRLLNRLLPSRRLFNSTGVRPMGPTSLVVAVGARSYWVHAQLQRGNPMEYRVVTSDIRDITDAATVVAAPPAAANVVPEVARRLDMYFVQSRAKVTYL